MIRTYWLWAALAALTFGCDDSSGGGGAGGEGGAGGATPADMGPMGGAGGEGGAGGAVLDGRELQLVGDRNALLFVGQSAMIGVRMVGGADQTPVAGENVEATLFDADGQEVGDADGTQLRSRRAPTGADGVATFELVAGATPTTLRIDFTNPTASAASVAITVAAEGAGGLDITVTYDPAANRYTYNDLVEARVDLFLADEIDCDLLRASAANPRGAWLSLPSINPFNEVDNQTAAGDLTDGQVFNVMATAINADGQTLTFGCTPDVAVVGGQIVPTAVAMSDLPLEFKGRFAAVSRFDLTDMLSNSDNETLRTIAEVMRIIRVLGNGDGDRGQELAALFCDVVEWDETVCTILERLGGPIVNEVFERVVPQLALDVLTALSDVVGILNGLTIEGEIEFISSYPDAEGMLAGNDNRWQRFRFTWRGEERAFTFGDLGREYRPVAGAFDAHVDGQTLTIGPHPMNLRLGVIALGLIELWIAPQFVGQQPPIRLETLLGAVIPCAAINDYIFDDPNNGLCEDVLVVALSELLEDQIGRLDLQPDAFTIEGTAQALDTNGDLSIDRLEGGVWDARVRIGGDEVRVPGCLKACRDDRCADPTCEIQR